MKLHPNGPKYWMFNQTLQYNTVAVASVLVNGTDLDNCFVVN